METSKLRVRVHTLAAHENFVLKVCNGSKPATESIFKTHKTNNLCIARVVAT